MSDIDGSLFIGLIIAAYGSLGFAIVCRDPVLLDMAPKLAGTLHGLVDTIYSAGGFVVPIIGNALVDDYTIAVKWRPVWISVVGCCLVWLIVFYF